MDLMVRRIFCYMEKTEKDDYREPRFDVRVWNTIKTTVYLLKQVYCGFLYITIGSPKACFLFLLLVIC